MEMVGDLDWLPDVSLDEYEKLLLEPGRKPGLWEVHRRKFAVGLTEFEAARTAAVEQVWREVKPLLNEAGVPEGRRSVYRGLVGACCTAALSCEPGSEPERREIDAYVLNPHWIGLGLDTALAQRLAGIMIPRFCELAKTLPPDPRPRR